MTRFYLAADSTESLFTVEFHFGIVTDSGSAVMLGRKNLLHRQSGGMEQEDMAETS